MATRHNFFKSAFGSCDGGRLDVRAIKAGLPPVQRFFALDNFARIDEFCNSYKDRNVYFGVGTRDDSGSGAKANVVHVPALWADIDYKDIKPADLKPRVASFPFKPSAVILSGHGIQPYWFLREPAEKGDFDLVEDLLRRICAHFNADPSACEIARVLRMPGTMNVKSKPVPAKLHRLEQFTYNLEDFEVLKEVKKRETPKGTGRNEARWLVEVMRGIPEGGNDAFPGRDVAGVKLAGYLIDRLPRADVLAFLRGWNTRNQPPLADADLQRICRSVSRYSERPGDGKKEFKNFILS